MPIFRTTTPSAGSSIFQTNSSSGGSSMFRTTPTASQLDLEGLAQQYGIEKPEEKKLSLLGRLGAGLSSFETGNAVYTGLEKHSIGAGVGSYVTGVFKGVGSAITGHDYGQTDKKTYKDIAEKYGVHNAVAKWGLGFLGDVLLDPTTYFGGEIAKGGAKLLGKGTEVGLKAIGKLAPETEAGLRLAGKGAKDALGKAFVFGYGTTKGVPEKVLDTTGKVAESRAGIIASNIERLGTGTLSQSQSLELAQKLLEGKRAEFLAREAGNAEAKKIGKEAAKSADAKVQAVIDEQAARSQKFAKQAGVEDPFAVYFPGIKKESLQNFFESTKALRVGSEGYTKEFKNLLKDEELVMNPAEAFSKVETQIAKDNIVRSELGSMVREFGKPLDAFKSEDEALRAGYKVIKEKGMFGKPIGYLKIEDKKFIDNLISPEFTTIDAIAKHTGFDAITSLFKRSVTGLFPSFHVRNYVSGLMQNYEVLGAKALAPANIAMGQRMALKIAKQESFGKEIIKLGEHEYSLNKVMEPFAKRFGGSSQYYKDIEDATAYTTKPLTKVKSLNPLSADNIVFRKSRAIGNFIETQQKATAYITALKDGKSVKEALDLATRAGFDYRALTPFESKILRRIIPFYSFTRKNIELQLRTLGENPQRISNIIKMMRDAGNMTEEERSQLPDYAREQFTFKFGKDYIVGTGSPLEQLSQLFSNNGKDDSRIRRWAATLNPLIKLPLERAFGKDFFRNRPLNEVVEAGEYSKAPKWVKEFLQVKEVKQVQKDGTTKTVYNANPYRLQLLRNLPTTRGAAYISAIADERGTTSKILSAFTGVKARPIDLETVKYFKDREREKEIENLLIQAGVLKKYEKTYIPKNQTVVK